MKNGGGHFAPELGGHFELELGAHFKLELGGQYHWNLHSIALSFCSLRASINPDASLSIIVVVYSPNIIKKDMFHYFIFYKYLE